MKKLEETIEQIEQLLSKLFSYRLFWILSIIVAIIILVLAYLYWVSAPEFLDYDYAEQESHELHSSVIRNRGWFLWMILSFMGLLTGLYFTYWGRKTQEQQWQTQQKSHLQERYENAASMLGNEALSIRVAGCRALMSLGIEDNSMKMQCVRLLFAFINNPYLKSDNGYENTDDLFPENNIRADIQEAADSFSAIYDHYGDEGIDNKRVKLADYFLITEGKNPVSLIKANLILAKMKEANLRNAKLQGADLSHANLEGADLSHANLQGAFLYNTELRGVYFQYANLSDVKLPCSKLQEADLSHADLRGANLLDTNLQGANFDQANLGEANLSGADISGANMNSRGLLREQILSAKWGIDDGGENNPPLLTEELECDSEVQKWLAKPHYDNREKTN